MKHLLITGPEGSGKSTIAEELAKAGKLSYVKTTEWELKNHFGFGLIADAGLVIVDEFGDLEWASIIVKSDEIQIERKGHNPELIKTPKFIFVSNSINPLKIGKNLRRRFITIEVNRES